MSVFDGGDSNVATSQITLTDRVLKKLPAWRRAWTGRDNGRYRDMAAMGNDALTVLQLTDPLSGDLQFGGHSAGRFTDAKTNTNLILDYNSPTNFKYASATIDANK